MSILSSVLAIAPGSCPTTAVRYSQHLSPTEIAQLAHGAGFRGLGLVYAVAISLAESGGYVFNCGADANGTADMGLWQLNSAYHSPHVAYQPGPAAAQAYAVSNKGSDFGAWCTAWANPNVDCGKSGLSAPQPGSAAFKYLPLAAAAASSMGALNASSAQQLGSIESGLAPANNPVAKALAKANPLAGIAGALTGLETGGIGAVTILIGVILMLGGVGILVLQWKGGESAGKIGSALTGLTPVGQVSKAVKRG